VRLALTAAALGGAAIVVLTVVTRDVDDRGALALVVAGATLTSAGLAGLGAIFLEERAAAGATPRRRPAHRGRAARRGIGLGLVVGAFALLRAVDGLSVITATFVLAGFVLAELVLSSRRLVRSG